MNCIEVIKKLYDYLDRESDQTDVDAIHAHLEQCRPCFDHYNFDRLLKNVVREGLKNSKLSSIAKLKLYEKLKTEK